MYKPVGSGTMAATEVIPILERRTTVVTPTGVQTLTTGVLPAQNPFTTVYKPVGTQAAAAAATQLFPIQERRTTVVTPTGMQTITTGGFPVRNPFAAGQTTFVPERIATAYKSSGVPPGTISSVGLAQAGLTTMYAPGGERAAASRTTLVDNCYTAGQTPLCAQGIINQAAYAQDQFTTVYTSAGTRDETEGAVQEQFATVYTPRGTHHVTRQAVAAQGRFVNVYTPGDLSLANGQFTQPVARTFATVDAPPNLGLPCANNDTPISSSRPISGDVNYGRTLFPPVYVPPGVCAPNTPMDAPCTRATVFYPPESGTIQYSVDCRRTTGQMATICVPPEASGGPVRCANVYVPPDGTISGQAAALALALKGSGKACGCTTGGGTRRGKLSVTRSGTSGDDEKGTPVIIQRRESEGGKKTTVKPVVRRPAPPPPPPSYSAAKAIRQQKALLDSVGTPEEDDDNDDDDDSDDDDMDYYAVVDKKDAGSDEDDAGKDDADAGNDDDAEGLDESGDDDDDDDDEGADDYDDDDNPEDTDGDVKVTFKSRTKVLPDGTIRRANNNARDSSTPQRSPAYRPRRTLPDNESKHNRQEHRPPCDNRQWRGNPFLDNGIPRTEQNSRAQSPLRGRTAPQTSGHNSNYWEHEFGIS